MLSGDVFTGKRELWVGSCLRSPPSAQRTYHRQLKKNPMEPMWISSAPALPRVGLMQSQLSTSLPIPSCRLGLEKRYRGVSLGPSSYKLPQFLFFPLEDRNHYWLSQKNEVYK